MFYVYAYFDPTKPSSLHSCGFEPFYIGKGKEDRMYHHLFESNLKGEKNKHKSNKIKKLLNQNIKPHIELLLQNVSEQEALDFEIFMIAKWGRADLNLGPLTNMTSGGEGSSGMIFSEEYRKKLSEGTKRAHAAGKLKSNIDAFKNSLRGKKQTQEHIKKRADARRGRSLNEETRRKISEAHKKIRCTNEWKQIASLAQKGKKHSREHIEKSIMSNPKSKPVEVFGVKYISRNQALKATGLTPAKLIKEPSFKWLKLE
ncbi:MAG: GIY-YIG nuclease family protein [Candidatus Woesearchaeota archaeon]